MQMLRFLSSGSASGTDRMIDLCTRIQMHANHADEQTREILFEALAALRDADIKLQHIHDLSKPERRAK